MSDWVAHRNGRFVPLSELRVSPFDVGFIQGVTISEQLRTFGGQPFRVSDHWHRLANSLKIVGLADCITRTEFESIVGQIARLNSAFLPNGSDLAISFWVTPGPHAKFHSMESPKPSIGCFGLPLDFHNWSHLYTEGQHLVCSPIRQVPQDCWPSTLKCRSRMHYFLADRAAAAVTTGAKALLLDEKGFVCETAIANVVMVKGQTLVSPRHESILPGISLLTVMELAKELGWEWEYRDVRPQELHTSNEVLLCSTSACVWPATQLDQNKIADGKPGPVFEQLVAAWSRRVGIDIVDQAIIMSTEATLGDHREQEP